MTETGTENLLKIYKEEMYAELNNILSYWTKNTCDNLNGGFIGRIDERNIPYTDSPKGAVLNSRILWAFSEAYSITKNEEHLHIARVAYNYLASNFIDKKYGGVYWALNADGTPLDSKKQVYAIAFAVYGCCSFFKVSGTAAAKSIAIELFTTIEQYSYDEKYTGYLEAFTVDWKQVDDLRLSKKDANEKKTMNTHLHILEAYTSLYLIWPNEIVKEKIVKLVKNFTDHIIDANTHHLTLFFNEQWTLRSTTISYGHDIEAAWLIQEAANTIKEFPLINRIKILSAKLADAASQGLDEDGSLWYEYKSSENFYIKEKHWWVQAEAMVGFFNSWQITGEQVYLTRSFKVWEYVKYFIMDHQYGEWLWGRNEDGTIMDKQDKVGIWKCPYHNSRACIEIIKRINNI